MGYQPALADGAALDIEADGQRWRLTWHPPSAAPSGRNQGSSGICLTNDGELVIVSQDGVSWDLPGGRPEGDESREETLRRELWEEACATVGAVRLLGFARAECLEGREAGVALVRAFWRAEVQLEAWAPAFEIACRRTMAPAAALDQLAPAFAPVFARALVEAAAAAEPRTGTP